MQFLTDEQLVNAYCEGQKDAFDFLIQRYLKGVYNFSFRFFGNRQDAEDIAQEVFVRAWKNLKKFDQRRSFKTWLYSIAKNAAIDHLRKKRAVPFSELERTGNLLLEFYVDERPLPGDVLERKLGANILNETVGELPFMYREVLRARYHDDLSFREIAEKTGDPLHTVKSRHRRALLALRRLFIRPSESEV